MLGFVHDSCPPDGFYSPFEANRKLRARRQGPNESVCTFAADLRALARTVLPQSSALEIDRFVFGQFCDGIRDQRQRELVWFALPRTLDEALDVALRGEVKQSRVDVPYIIQRSREGFGKPYMDEKKGGGNEAGHITATMGFNLESALDKLSRKMEECFDKCLRPMKTVELQKSDAKISKTAALIQPLVALSSQSADSNVSRSKAVLMSLEDCGSAQKQELMVEVQDSKEVEIDDRSIEEENHIALAVDEREDAAKLQIFEDVDALNGIYEESLPCTNCTDEMVVDFESHFISTVL